MTTKPSLGGEASHSFDQAKASQHTPGPATFAPVYDSTGRLMAAVARVPALCPSGSPCVGYGGQDGRRYCCYCGRGLAAISKTTGEQA